MTQEAAPGATVTYTFTAGTPGTHSYYSGTQGDLQVEMGLFGAIIVIPARFPPTAPPDSQRQSIRGESTGANRAGGWLRLRILSPSWLCLDREICPQFPNGCQYPCGPLNGYCQVRLHRGRRGLQSRGPHRAVSSCFFMINGRSMPDDMDPNYDTPYPHQPYNGNPHRLHPGEQSCCDHRQAGGSTRSTSMPTTFASWLAMAISSSRLTARASPVLRCSPRPQRPVRPWTGSSSPPAAA